MTLTLCTDRLPDLVSDFLRSRGGFFCAATLLLSLAALPANESFAQLVKDLPKTEALQQPSLGTSTRGDIRDFSDPAVTITQRGNHEIREYRAGGRVYTKVTPRNAPPYYLESEEGSDNMQWRRSALQRSAPATWKVLQW